MAHKKSAKGYAMASKTRPTAAAASSGQTSAAMARKKAMKKKYSAGKR